MIKALSEKIVADAVKENPVAATDLFSVIETVSKIINELVRIYQSCNKTPAAAAMHMRDVSTSGLIGWINRRRLWRMIESAKLPASISHADIYLAVLRTGSNITTEDVWEMYKESM